MKKLLSILLIATMLLSTVLVVVPVGAEAGAEEEETLSLPVALPEGYTPVGTPITSEAEWLAMKPNTTYYLANNITVTAQHPNASGYINGTTIDGNGKTVTYTGDKAMFSWASGVTVKNLIIDAKTTVTANSGNDAILTNGWDQKVVLSNILCNVDLTYAANHGFCGALVAKVQNGCNLDMDDIVISGTVTVNEGVTLNDLGGLVGYIDDANAVVDIDNCVNKAEFIINGTVSNGMGGLVGRIQNGKTVTIDNSENLGNITTASKVTKTGGLVGMVKNATISFTNCSNKGDIDVAGGNGTFTGGLLAQAYPSAVTIDKCSNEGDILIRDTKENGNEAAAGLVGEIRDSKMGITHVIKNSINKGAVTVTTGKARAFHAAGIVGKFYACSDITIMNCVNAGEIMALEAIGGWADVGGIVSCFNTVAPTSVWNWSNIDSATYNIINCHNLADLGGYSTAGIVGAGHQMRLAKAMLNISYCSNSGDINGTNGAGGIVGRYGINEGDNYCGLSLNYCYNEGAIDGVGYAGGLVGDNNSMGAKNAEGTEIATMAISNSANVGTYTSKDLVLNAGKENETIVNESGNLVAYSKVAAVLTNNAENDAAVAAIKEAAYSYVDANVKPIFIFSGAQWNNKPDGDVYIYRDFTLTTSGGIYSNGTVYGQDHTITVDDAIAINIANNVTIKDLNLAGSIDNTTGMSHVSPLTHHGSNGKFVLENVTSDVDINITSGTIGSIGGLVSKAEGSLTMKNCEFTGSITVSGAVVPNYDAGNAIGGLAGMAKGALVLEDCETTGDITVSNIYFTGALVGKTLNTANVKNCVNSGDITVAADTVVLGGLFGETNGLALSDSSNSGDITVKSQITKNDSKVAGIVGRSGGEISLTDVEWTGKIVFEAQTNASVGGIIGRPGANSTYTDCLSDGEITFEQPATIWNAYTGGFIGETPVGVTTTLNNCVNKTDITNAKSLFMAGFVGVAFNGQLNFNGCVNEGNITIESLNDASALVAGFVAYCDTSVSIKNSVNNGAIAINAKATEGANGIGGFIAKVQRNTATVVVQNSVNTGDITSKANSYAGGIIGYAPMSTGSVTVENCINTGSVTTSQTPYCAGGIIGYVTGSNASAQVTVDKCLNLGDVTGSTYVGGIIGDVIGSNGFWKLSITDSVNTGAVLSTYVGGCGIGSIVENITAGGILGRIKGDGADFAVIDGCVNAGSVTITNESNGRGCDSWKIVGGILGEFNTKISISNCIHMGSLASNGGASVSGTFPITNAIETMYNGSDYYNTDWFAARIKAENNIYLDGTALQTKVKHVAGTYNGQYFDAYTLSTKADKATVYAKIAELEVVAYDVDTLTEAVDKYSKIKTENFTDASMAALTEALDEAATLLTEYNEADDKFSFKQAPFNAAELKILAAAKNLVAAGDVTFGLDAVIDEAKAASVGGNYTAESWNNYQAAIKFAENVLLQGSAADPADVELAKVILEEAIAQLTVGGTIRTAEDFAKMDGQDGEFTLAADITVTAPIDFKGTLHGNGHIIYTTGAIFNSMDNAWLENVVVIAIDDIDAALFGEAKGGVVHVDDVVVMVNNADSAVFSKVTETELYVYSSTVIVNGVVNADAAIVAEAENSIIYLVDMMFLGDVNGKAALIGDVDADVAVIGAIVYATVTGDETVAGIVSSANEVVLVGIYFEGVLDAEEISLIIGSYVDGENSVIETCYAYALTAEGGLVDGVEIADFHSGKATYEINEIYEECGWDKPFVQRIGFDATPVFGTPNADLSNVVIYDEETETYKNVFIYGDYTSGTLPELPIPTAPAAPAEPAMPGLDTLNSIIAKAEATDLTKYTKATADAVEAALAAALEARLSRTQEEVDAAVADLVYALACLQIPTPVIEVKVVDVSGLNASITAAEALKAEDYTATSWAAVQAVLATAKARLTSTSQALVDNAKASLDAMVKALIKAEAPAPVVVDYSKLNADIATADALVAADYTTDSWATLQAMLTVAKSATSASQDAVDQAQFALTRAIAGLVKAPEEVPVVEEKGCGSTITGASVALVAVLALGAGVTFKKKED